MKALVWFRRDLRLQDNPALTAVLASGLPVEAIFIYSQTQDAPLATGAASRWYLHCSLLALQQRLADIGIPLSLLRGSEEELLLQHCADKSITQLYWNQIVEPRQKARSAIRRFLSEIGWQEFGRHVLHAFPHTVEHSMNTLFDQEGIWWPNPDRRMVRAWQQGETGIALVDAGMRELWETGWMHNRVRMIVGSFLTKNLGIHWREGARWFHDTLVDADLASNTLGWQWVAGCGTDAAPYFRIFNPDTQAKKFDPEGRYIARWLGDRMPYPPIVDLKLSRTRALQRYQRAIRQQPRNPIR